jgi:hypothetical protein
MVPQNLNLILPTGITADWCSMLCSMNPSGFEKPKSSKCTGLYILNMQCQSVCPGHPSFLPTIEHPPVELNGPQRAIWAHLAQMWNVLSMVPTIDWLVSSLSPSLRNTGNLELIYNGNFWVGLQRKSIRGDFWAYSVKILVFPVWTGYMLTSFGFSLLSKGIFCKFL